MNNNHFQVENNISVLASTILQQSYGVDVFLVVIPQREKRIDKFPNHQYYEHTTVHTVIFRFHKLVKNRNAPSAGVSMLTLAEYGLIVVWL